MHHWPFPIDMELKDLDDAALRVVPLEAVTSVDTVAARHGQSFWRDRAHAHAEFGDGAGVGDNQEQAETNAEARGRKRQHHPRASGSSHAACNCPGEKGDHATSPASPYFALLRRAVRVARWRAFHVSTPPEVPPAPWWSTHPLQRHKLARSLRKDASIAPAPFPIRRRMSTPYGVPPDQWTV